MPHPDRVRAALDGIAATDPDLLRAPKRREPVTFCFTIPGLPQRLLSSNGGNRSRRDPWAVANAKGELKGETIEALMEIQPLPTFDRCTVALTLLHSNKKPKVEQCPRCLLAAIEDRRIDACRCYRPADVGNIGGDVLKPILDGMVWMEMMPDDDWTHLVAVTLRIGRVATVEDERIEVRVQEAA